MTAPCCPNCGAALPVLGGLTARQKDVCDFISVWIAVHGTSPSFSDIAEGVGLRSRSGALRIVRELVERGRVSRIPNRSRSIQIVEARQ